MNKITKLGLQTLILITAIMPLLFIVVLNVIGTRSISELVETSRWVLHTQEVISKARRIEKLVVDIETGQRGYLIAGEEEFLEPYYQGKANIKRELTVTRELVSDNPPQVERLIDIEAQMERWFEEAGEVEINARKGVVAGTAKMEEVIALIQTKRGKSYIDALRKDLNEFIQVEEKLLGARQEKSYVSADDTTQLIYWGTFFILLVSIIISLIVTRLVTKPLGKALESAERIAGGDLETEISLSGPKEIQALGGSMQKMQKNLKSETSKLKEQDWIKTNHANINEKLQGLKSLSDLAGTLIAELVPVVSGQLGVVYIKEKTEKNESLFKLLGSYGYKKRKTVSNQYRPGESLVGQCVLEKKPIQIFNVPDDYLQVVSGLGHTTVKRIMLHPILFENEVNAVIEIGFLKDFTKNGEILVELVANNLGVLINNIQSRELTENLLQATQKQSEELKSQREELKISNEELQERTETLKDSETELRKQGEELRASNEELEGQRGSLESQKEELEAFNDQLKESERSLEQKTKLLERAGKYKSEFLANMSHELRTPLNSILILSQFLAENKAGHLNERDVESADTIHSAGADLLNLINDILDLSKIEAGKLEINVEDANLRGISENLMRTFKDQMEKKGLDFKVDVSPDLPSMIRTDQFRVEQVLKNLISNAFKFTEKGSVTLTFGRPQKGDDLSQSGLHHGDAVSISVTDTGVGIPADKQDLVFFAFQQVDGSVSRKYGGTGLGLSICRVLSEKLGGEIHLSSEQGKGSTFTFFLPEIFSEESREQVIEAEEMQKQVVGLETDRSTVVGRKSREWHDEVKDDRKTLKPGERLALIIDDDPQFSKVLYNNCHDFGFQCLRSENGKRGISDARKFSPDVILLDIRLPDVNGIAVLDKLKAHSKTRHIPVHVVSIEDRELQVLRMGAVGFTQKPVEKEVLEEVLKGLKERTRTRVNRLLLVEDNKAEQLAIKTLIGNHTVETVCAGTAKEAINLLEKESFDCIVMDLGLPDLSGYELLSQISKIKSASRVPVIVHTGREQSKANQELLERFSRSVIIKGVKSHERLLDEVTLFLHQPEDKMSNEKREILLKARQGEDVLRGRMALLVDDDERNLNALKRVVEESGLKTCLGKTGKEALEALEKDPNIDIVLMDIMMPEMDGYEAMKKIRKSERFKNLTIIALTAKAMKGDREKCLEAGASDYLTKPVDPDQLVSLMKVWMKK